MDVALILVAFALGLAASMARLPALVGYLVAGFVLFSFGFETTELIETVSDLGVYLLLFGIGLKLRIRFIARPEVWGSATISAGVMTAVISGVLLIAGLLGLPMLLDIDLGQAALLGFVFALSSTVFTVKILEGANEVGSLSGRIAVGVLIVQDVLAVAFLAALSRELPTLWAIPMVVLLLTLRPMFGWLVRWAGHGELLVLLGFAMAVGIGAGGFELVGLKPELGALIAGIVVASHPRAGEMADRMLDFKDIFLVGFFLSIGLAGTPPVSSFGVIVLILLLLPIKTAVFFLLFTRFRLRSRTSLYSSLSLSSYSEFGLIVAVASQANGYLGQEWVTTIAVAVALSFVVASGANSVGPQMFLSRASRLARFERQPYVLHDAVIDCGYAQTIIFGMGRVGVGAYDEIAVNRSANVVGVDRNSEVVSLHTAAGRNVVRGEALDREFWEGLCVHADPELIIVAMDDHGSNLVCVERATEYLPGVRIASIARYPDQVLELRDAGVDVARNLYEEAGQGLADDAVSMVRESTAEVVNSEAVAEFDESDGPLGSDDA